jgi:hypothetical protein
VLVGRTASGIGVEHRFSADAASEWIEEQIKITNEGSVPLDLRDARCGFVLPIAFSQGKPDAKLAAQKFSAIPFLREPQGSARTQYAEFSLEELFTQKFETGLWVNRRIHPNGYTVTNDFAAEGWSWRHAGNGFLITKYAQNGMEWSMLDHLPLSPHSVGLRWGGLGIHLGNPEPGTWISPGQSHLFGATRVTAVRGDRNQAFYAFRAEMAARGHGCPQGFDPPIHWNELYDNKLFFLPNGKQDDPEMRKKHYTLEDMKGEAAKAKAIGCEALYLDPGWDTNFASKIWDEARLGSFKSFTTLLEREYGLKCSLHTPLSGWCNPTSYSSDCYRLDKFGNRAKWVGEDWGDLRYSVPPICGASRQYLDETTRRLAALCKDGAAFLMFDGTNYKAPCWDPNHGHAIPAQTEEHTRATLRLARQVHESHPDVLIEMHDPVSGASFSRYVPIYYGHGRCQDSEGGCKAAGFDSVWAFELMLDQLGDLMNGKAITLYYYNLAYSLPLYIHIDLRVDNENALSFWWNASTCRHLGIGGTPTNPAVVKSVTAAMKTYKRLKPYFTHGEFYGIDEMTHVHRAADRKSAVINCFNLEGTPVTREVRINPSDLGLEPGRHYRFTGAGLRKSGEGYTGTINIAAQGHTLIEMM